MHHLLFLLLHTAANVTIIGTYQTNGYHGYLVEVTQSWILDEENCSQHNGLSYVLVRASYSHCNRCPNLNDSAGPSEVDNVYLIGGYCNDRGWTLPPNDSLCIRCVLWGSKVEEDFPDALLVLSACILIYAHAATIALVTMAFIM